MKRPNTVKRPNAVQSPITSLATLLAFCVHALLGCCAHCSADHDHAGHESPTRVVCTDKAETCDVANTAHDEHQSEGEPDDHDHDENHSCPCTPCHGSHHCHSGQCQFVLTVAPAITKAACINSVAFYVSSSATASALRNYRFPNEAPPRYQTPLSECALLQSWQS